jgi:hypothetical protein
VSRAKLETDDSLNLLVDASVKKQFSEADKWSRDRELAFLSFLTLFI